MTCPPPDDWEKPSTYAPLFRRLFGSEHQREVKETFELYDQVARLARKAPTVADHGRWIGSMFAQRLPGFDLRDEFISVISGLVVAEAYMFEMPPRSLQGMTMAEEVRYRAFLNQKLRYLENLPRYDSLLREHVMELFLGLANVLPKTTTPSPFTIRLINAVPNPREVVQHIYSCFAEPALQERAMFERVTAQLSRNLAEVSGVPYDDPKPKKPLKFPIDSKLPAEELQQAYLKGTVFDELMSAPVPLRLTHHEQFSHMHVVGGTGAGKTTLLENMILHDLHSEDPPALVVVDSQGDLIRKISRLALMNDRRCVLISPKDVHYPPALNVFDVHRARFEDYDQATREQVTAGVIETFDYLFTGLIGADLTAKQEVFFRYVARLMLLLPETLGRNATILDMIALMEDPTPYKDAIASLPAISRNFFERDFPSKTFAQTREQIRYRLHAVIENPTLGRLFSSPTTKVDLFEELNRGSIILVDTAKDFLKGSSAHFGQIFISLVLQAVLERAALPEAERRHAFLYVDEAAEYFDSNVDDLLRETRKQKLGCIFAHQYLDQCSSALRASLAANTATKFAAGVSTSDARFMAADMRTTADFILEQPRLHFAAHIRNVTPHAVSIPVRIGLLDAQPRMSDDDFRRFLERNREGVAYQPTDADGPGRPSSSSSDVGEEVSDEW